MDAQTLQDRVSKGMGVAARKSGSPVCIYRPHGFAQPVMARNKIAEIPAMFLPGGAGTSLSYGTALWRGVYDAAYSVAGDYLVGRDDTYFVAGQRLGLPVQCVLTNRLISIVRPTPALQSGYSGFFASSGEPIVVQWPASLLETGGRSGAGEFGEMRFGAWVLLLPPTCPVPQVGDVVNDERGGVYTIGSAEQSAWGWRLLMRQVAV